MPNSATNTDYDTLPTTAFTLSAATSGGRCFFGWLNKDSVSVSVSVSVSSHHSGMALGRFGSQVGKLNHEHLLGSCEQQYDHDHVHVHVHVHVTLFQASHTFTFT
jgi:hypothetical protein